MTLVLTDLCQAEAKKGNPYAQYILGLYYENRIGGIKKALELYERAAEQEYSKAQSISKVYTFYENGFEVKKK